LLFVDVSFVVGEKTRKKRKEKRGGGEERRRMYLSLVLDPPPYRDMSFQYLRMSIRLGLTLIKKVHEHDRNGNIT
jgi:hypothetical protein